MKKLNEDKKTFLESVVPVWDKKSEERHDKMKESYTN